MRDLEGRAAVVFGGGGGIGRSIVLGLARAGVAVVVADINAPGAEEAAGEARALGGRSIGVPCDVTEDAAVAGLLPACLAAFGRCDIVVNDVALLVMGLPEEIPFEAWKRAFDVNVMSVVRSIATFVPHFLGQGAGHFVNIASTAGLYPYSYDRMPYQLTKAAILRLSEGLALYLRPQGVGVTCFCPGPVHGGNIGASAARYNRPERSQSPDLPPIEVDAVGDLVVEAIRADRFLGLTHEEVRDRLVEWAADVDGYVDRAAREIAGKGADNVR